MKVKSNHLFSLEGDFNIWDVVEALLLNDSEEIKKMAERCKQLKSAHKKFIEEIESGDEDRKRIAISSFKRPER